MIYTLVEVIIEYYVFVVLGMFFAMVLLELAIPAVELDQSITKRWYRNFGLGFLGVLVSRIAGPILGGLLALVVSQEDLGLFNYLALPDILAILLSFLLLDLKSWCFHKLSHMYSWLWRIHQVHHCDTNFDVSTGFRFHPIESVLGGIVSMIVIVAFGIMFEAIVLRGVYVYFVNFFTHANVNLPDTLDRCLRSLFVTPAMHRIHHSCDVRDSNTNFGTVFSIWDRMFRTYSQKSILNNTWVPVGIDDLPGSGRLGLWSLLVLPFRAKTAR